MRIGFDAKRLFNNFTGLGNHSRTTIDMLTTYFSGNEYYLYTPKLRLNEVTAPFAKKDGCHVVQPHGFMKGSAWRTVGIAGDAKRDGVQLFHGLSNELPMGLRRKDIASVVTIHDVAFHTFTDMYHWHDRQIYDLKWRYACKNADRIIAISECTKCDIIKFYDVDEDKIDIVYQPVNLMYYDAQNVVNVIDFEHRKQVMPKEYMLYVGSINSRKNLLGIVKAMEMMPEDLQLPLAIVGGGGAYKKEVLSYIESKGMSKRFIWLEVRETDLLLWLYSHASLFVYPSFYEGFGLPVVEAQLCGCPVVTSNVSSLPEAGGKYALQADPSSVEDISHKMVQALTDTDLRAKMIEKGRERAMDTFHPEVLANRLMDVYEATLLGRE